MEVYIGGLFVCLSIVVVVCLFVCCFDIQCKSATVLRVANALGRLLCQATAPPPGVGGAGEATPTFPELHGRAAVKLAADLHQCQQPLTSASAPERTADAFMQYWREMAA